MIVMMMSISAQDQRHIWSMETAFWSLLHSQFCLGWCSQITFAWCNKCSWDGRCHRDQHFLRPRGCSSGVPQNASHFQKSYIFQVKIRKGNSCDAWYPTSHENLRNNFMNCNIQYVVARIVRLACWKDVRFVWFGKKVHLEPFQNSQTITSIHKSLSKCQIATQLLSGSVAAAIRTYVAFGKMESMALQTADFIDKINCLFVVMNSQTHHATNKK